MINAVQITVLVFVIKENDKIYSEGNNIGKRGILADEVSNYLN